MLKFIRGQFLEIIEWPEEGRETLMWRFPDDDREIKQGAQLTVRESQVALFVNEGQLADVFGPGRHELVTRNIPILSRLRGWKYGFNSPFKVDIFFVNTQEYNLPWGTPSPISYSDNTFFSIDLRAHGNLFMQITDAAEFYRKVAGNQAKVSTDEVMNHLRALVVDEFGQSIAQSGMEVREILRNNAAIGPTLLPTIAQDLQRYGIQANRLTINVKLPDEVVKELQSSDLKFRDQARMKELENQTELQNLMGKANISQQVGDMNKFMQFQAGSSMNPALNNNPSGGGGDNTMGKMMEMGMGINMAQQMMQGMNAAQQQPQAQQPAAGNGGAMDRDEVMKRLRELGELKEMGILTEAEFDTKKAELLARL
jgi:membrane protease subunit (stomatin/prohibitin family)